MSSQSTRPPPSTTSIGAESDLASDKADLRTDFVEAYGTRVFMALSTLGSLFLLPFAIYNLMQGRLIAGLASGGLALCLVINAAMMLSGRGPPFPPLFLFAPALAALAVAMHQQGLIGILWSYVAVLLFHFVLPRLTANLFNSLIVMMAVAMAWIHLGPAITARVGVTLLLTMLFTNIFSYIVDAQRRKEVEQRHRLDLLVRGTNAGTLEWEADGSMHYSARLRQMLGRAHEIDGARWDFFSFVHTDDRERVRAQMEDQFTGQRRPRSVWHQPSDEFRLLHASGNTVWVHTEGIVVSDTRGRVKSVICSFLDITESVEAQEQLRQQAQLLAQQNQALREAMRMREEVERIARHDLKTPLGSIASVPRIMREHRALDSTEHQLLGMVERAALRVLSMVNLSLDLYRMEEGSYRVRAQPVSLQGVVGTVMQELRAHAESKDVKLRLVAARQGVHVEGEELLCYSIVANLVKNAIEAAPESSTVEVVVDLDEPLSEGVLRIRNEGAVPAGMRERFFEKYATDGKPGGTGLGAYSARLMARVQGGDLSMSTNETRGTTELTLLLPSTTELPPGESGTRGSAERAISGHELLPLSLLLVDDDPYNITVLRAQLPEPPLEVHTAVNGRAALQFLTRQRVDVIFLDLQMPVMGGVETIAHIRALQASRSEAPSIVVAFSARDDEQIRLQCHAAGFDHFILKPAAPQELLAVLSGLPSHRIAREPEEPIRWVDANIVALLPEFVSSRRELLRELQAAASAADRGAVRRLAHMLNGSLAMYGFTRASGIARALEEAAQDDSEQALVEGCARLLHVFEEDQALMHARQNLQAV